jgi:NADH pyrophosphatase NudC (nudix superfamily)
MRREAVAELARRRAAPVRPARSDSESGARARPARAAEAEKAVRFCSDCGGKVTPEARFCSACGHKL